MRNFLDLSRSEFVDEVVRCRELLAPISTGVIQRGRRESQYDPDPGTRRTTFKDAQKLATVVIARLNKAINTFTEGFFE
jgi:hypothetical protein